MKQLSLLCRNLRQPLEGGLSLLQTVRMLAKRRRGLEPILGAHLAERLQQGESFGDALAAFRPELPNLFLSMVHVGEETGRLPDTLRSLEDYYTLQERMLSQIRRRLSMLLVQLGLAVLVLAGVIGITTTISPKGGFSILGLRGWGGALGFIGIAVAAITGLVLAVKLLGRGMQTNRFLASVARKLPGLGPFLEALLLSRFALGLRLTLDSSISLPEALTLSFRATGDAIYRERGEGAVEAIRRGKDLSKALARTDLFPMMFLEVLAIAEVSGVVPERMGQMAQEYHEEAERRAKGLVQWASLGLWLLYAAAVILAVFKLAGMYLGALGA